MTQDNRETLQRAVGILEGLSASGEITQATTDMILNVAEMIDAVLDGEKKV